ncbi:MAG: 16S rRNA (adenine(1518)-N(6)/adenine(1519)-N(6))-dimethyltransferase RsmA [Ruminococcus sp.]|nr:16S rRNA (adenine(1518)-N(6)/adenine(1519)-N(6))-dimethyltransferase RsmA [Ruminococcus sp.]
MMNLTDIATVKLLLERHGFHFSKKLGQNFLINPTVCLRIAEMGGAAPGHGILEIGPGIGTLTQQLAMRADRVTAIELDQRLLPILQETVGSFDNLHVLHGDILQYQIPELFEQEFPNMPVSICANLPYYITTPILIHLLESGAAFESITVMVQKEVAEKLCADVGTRQSGVITVAVHYHGTVKLLFPVSRGSFLPPPNVDSAVIQIRTEKKYDALTKNQPHFFAMVRNGFSQRRKTLVNALSATMGYPKPILIEALQKLGVSETIRIEKLPMETLIALSNLLFEMPLDKNL